MTYFKKKFFKENYFFFFERTRLTMGSKNIFAFKGIDRIINRIVRDQDSLNFGDERYRTIITSSNGNN
jgi:hypothetical protein